MKVKSMVHIAFFTVLMAVCSWISVPAPVPFTLQTLAVFCAVGVLGGKKASVSVILYILMGTIGLPVFSGFMGGVGALLGPTGGYIIGFIFLTLVMRGILPVFKNKTAGFFIAAFCGLLACYAFGTLWFLFFYARQTQVADVLLKCVIPFIIPDILKLLLAYAVCKKIKRFSL